MVRDRVRCNTRYSGVDWFPMTILGGREGDADSVSTLGGRAGVCPGDDMVHELASLFIEY